MLNVITGRAKRPRRIMLYGPHGIGKSTWASKAPASIFLQTEDGLADIGCDRTPLLKDLAAVNVWLSELSTQPHDYKTVVVDTLDWLERLIWSSVAAENGKNSIDEIPYYRGYSLAVRHWDFVLKTLDHLREEKGLAVILLSHAKVAKFEPPDADSYSRYEPDLHKSVAPMLQEWADEVLFANYKTIVVNKDEGFNRTRRTALDDATKRVVYTCEKPTHLAKRRLVLPDELPLEFGEYLRHVMLALGDGGNIAGLVKEGHSKQKETISG